MTEEHKNAINANIQSFNADVANEYDFRESTQLLNLVFAKILLAYDVRRKERKTEEESAQVIEKELGSESSSSIESIVPNPTVYSKEYPNTVFKPGIKMLDFACGTGLFAQRLAPYFQSQEKSTEIEGIDINPHFLKRFEERASSNTVPNVSLHAYLYDILDPNISEKLSKLENKYDVITCTISYHHIDNYKEVTKKLVTFLKPGGWIFIVDFYNEDVEKPTSNPQSAVRHMGGLKVSTMNETLRSYCGLENVSSARETRVRIWQQKSFIENHLPRSTIEKLQEGQLKTKKGKVGEDLYLVDVSLILAVGQKP
ncbi:uncharacterized protein PRCAT00005232001 [Priceomyces carsonii]|uniref:uncharacterized protein n=1 Tax=Priceomyces carsonii TaxID=28549 RepID=UPI002EDB9F9B|nr:unnamed protein product [Priceomyces carsonii]